MATPTLAATGPATAVPTTRSTPVVGGPSSALTYVYSVKFVCGIMQPPGPKPTLSSPPKPVPVVPGIYRTAINVHNFLGETVTITKKAVIALPEDEPRGAISKRVQDVLKDDEALEVDCQDVLKLLANVGTIVNPLTGFVTGFTEIQSPSELEVTVVYTMEEPLEQGVRIDVEQVMPHVISR